MSDALLADPALAGPAYGAMRTNLGALLRSFGDDVGQRVTPACSNWTVADVLAHLCGVCEDILAFEMDGVTTEAWTRKHVDRHRGESVGEILDRWDETASQVEQITALFPSPRAASQFVFDATTHAFDIRGALGDAEDRSSDAATIAASFLLTALDDRIVNDALPTLSLSLEGLHPAVLDLSEGAIVLGSGSNNTEPVMHLDTTVFEFVRGFGGRRCLEQLASLGWSSDPASYFVLFDGSPLQPPATPLVE